MAASGTIAYIIYSVLGGLFIASEGLGLTPDKFPAKSVIRGILTLAAAIFAKLPVTALETKVEDVVETIASK